MGTAPDKAAGLVAIVPPFNAGDGQTCSTKHITLIPVVGLAEREASLQVCRQKRVSTALDTLHHLAAPPSFPAGGLACIIEHRTCPNCGAG